MKPPGRCISGDLPIAKSASLPAPRPIVWSRLAAALIYLGLLIFVIFVTPYLIAHWRLVEAKGEADAVYLIRLADLRAKGDAELARRRLELKEEAEHAERRLEILDRKVELASLGFREVGTYVRHAKLDGQWRDVVIVEKLLDEGKAA